MVLTPKRHAPTDACASEHCYAHNVDESVTPFSYRVCGECLHVYETSHDLVKAWQEWTYKTYPEDRRDPPAAGDIAFCQYCLHDF